jgi:hypothetical protein
VTVRVAVSTAATASFTQRTPSGTTFPIGFSSERILTSPAPT